MFQRIDFDGASNSVAFRLNSLTVANKTYWGYRGERGNVNHYKVPGLWISKAQNTRGALVSGDIEFIFFDIPDTQILTFDDLIYEGADIKEGQNVVRKVSYSASVLLDDRTVWSAGNGSHIKELTRLLDAYKELPELPEGYDGWYKQSNRR